jgi:hypothetical protein
MVRAMTDEEARRAQIAENLQRADMHPIEETEGLSGLDRSPPPKRRQLARSRQRGATLTEVGRCLCMSASTCIVMGYLLYTS